MLLMIFEVCEDEDDIEQDQEEIESCEYAHVYVWVRYEIEKDAIAKSL